MKQNDASTVYQLVSFLLQYPSTNIKETLSDIKEEVATLSNEEIKKFFMTFIDVRETESLEAWCDEYIEFFDFGLSTNLYVTYVKLGEQRQRGIELLQLKELYQSAGFDVTDNELPDYLPLMLEYAAQVDLEKGNHLLVKYVNEINTIKENLVERDSNFVLLLDALFLQLEDNGISLKEHIKVEEDENSSLEKTIF